MSKKICEQSDISNDVFLQLPGGHYIYIDDVVLHRVKYTPYHRTMVFPMKQCNISTLVNFINKNFGGIYI